MMRRLPFLLILLLYVQISYAQIIAEVGEFDWNNSGSWVGGVVPVAGADVIIPDGANVTIQQTTNASATNVDVEDGGELNILGSLVLIEIGTLDVYNPVTGEIWMDRNLGASQIATAKDDNLAYGDLFQWGRAAEVHEKRNSLEYFGQASTPDPNSGDWDGLFITPPEPHEQWVTGLPVSMWQPETGINDPCPTGYRIPTHDELNAEKDSWTTDNDDGAFNSPLKLTVAGHRRSSDGEFPTDGVSGHYWSSSVDGSDSFYLYFSEAQTSMSSVLVRASGLSVRCIKHQQAK